MGQHDGYQPKAGRGPAVPPGPDETPNQGTSGKKDKCVNTTDGAMLPDVLYPILASGRTFSIKIDAIGEAMTAQIKVEQEK